MATEDIISLTEFKNHATGWIKKLESQPPVVLTQNGHGVAVVQSYEAYRQMQFELALLRRVRQAEADVAAGRTYTTEEVFADARKRLNAALAKKARG